MEKKTYLFDKPENRVRVRKYLFISLVVLLVVELILSKSVHGHIHFPWESYYGFYAVYGFVSCVLLVFIAKGMRLILKRKEDYYD
jgi:hypothetical protein